MQTVPHRPASWVYAALFGAIAIYHFFVLMDSEMPHTVAGRHLVFCLVDAAFAVLLWMWPRWLLIPVLALAVQQIWSHAGHDWQLWHLHRQLPWFGVGTMSAQLILVLILLQDEYRRHRARTCET